MTIAALNATEDFYILQKADITNKITDILMEINYATKESTDLAKETSAKKADAKEQYYDEESDDNSQYYDAVDDIENDYELELSQITNWENELQMQKQEYQTQLDQITTSKESVHGAKTKNIESSFSYGKGAS